MKKVAIISGSAGFLGTAIADKLFSLGFELALLYHHERPRAKGKIYQCDFSHSESIKEAVRSVLHDFKKIDLVVHAAEPRIDRKNLITITPEEFREKLEACVVGSFTFLTEAARSMKDTGGGTIIGITSEAIKESDPIKKMGAYVPGKFALHGILRELKGELAPFNIQVHEVAPGFMAGGLNKDLPSVLFEMAEKEYGKLQTPAEIAEEISSLL